MSLQASVRSCDVNVGEADRIQSDRFFNPQNMVCIPWNGIDSTGREVCPDSWWTKTAGCDSAEDRVMVENALRPKYMNYVTLNAAGIQSDIYGNTGIDSQGRFGNISGFQNSLAAANFDKSRYSITGSFGNQWRSDVNFQGCSVNAYERGQAQISAARKNNAALQAGFQANQYRQAAGGY